MTTAREDAPETPKPGQPAPRPAWRAPTVSRIDIRRTTYSAGSDIDMNGGSTPG
jgi:hypothetical protein